MAAMRRKKSRRPEPGAALAWACNGAPAQQRETLGQLGEQLKREAIRHLLPPRLARLHTPFFLKTSHRCASDVRRRLEEANIVGVGFGLKESEGTFTGTLAVRIYVRRKVALSRLGRAVRVPKEVAGHPTDVIAVSRLRWQARPISAGAGISAQFGKRGSAGCVVVQAGDATRHVLSAAHVLAYAANAASGDIIVEPPRDEPGSTRLGTLVDFEPLLDDGTDNLMDAALARLDAPGDVLPAPLHIGALDPAPVEPVLYASVRKFGAATGHTLGVVSDAQADVTMNGSVRYKDLFEIKGCEVPFSKGGDSGALVVDALTNRPMGLIVGGNGEFRTYATPISRVLARFHATIVT